MKDMSFKKKCEVGKLHIELVNAGFKIYGVSFDGENTIIHLVDEEEKDPAPVVEAHIYSEPVISRPIDPGKLKKVLKKKGIITDESEIE